LKAINGEIKPGLKYADGILMKSGKPQQSFFYRNGLTIPVLILSVTFLSLQIYTRLLQQDKELVEDGLVTHYQTGQ
jgi:hypothetical protein